MEVRLGLVLGLFCTSNRMGSMGGLNRWVGKDFFFFIIIHFVFIS